MRDLLVNNSLSSGSSRLALTLTLPAGLTYSVDASKCLASGAWTPLATASAVAG